MFRNLDEFERLSRSTPLLGSHQAERAEENDLDLDEGNAMHCDACTLPIFSTPYIQQDNDEGRSLLHECCAGLPSVITEHPLHAKPLHLLKQHVPSNNCYNCRRDCSKGFFYQCRDHECRFTLDVMCAAATMVKITHRSHQHALAVISKRSNRFTCGACGLEHEGEFYWCNFCNFYLHVDCALLPNTILHSSHEQHCLCLTYMLPKETSKFRKFDVCSICHESLFSIKSGMYFCTMCDYNIHIKCAVSEPANFRPVLNQVAIGGLIRLPMPNEHTSLMKRLLGHQSSQHSDSPDSTTTLLGEKIHDHDLIFHDGDGDGDGPSQSCLCNACIQPISSPFYSCPKCNDFYLHSCCANLPLQCQHLAHGIYSVSCQDQPLALHPSLPDKFLSGFRCHGCLSYCNGFVYKCEKCRFKLDVRCAFLPEMIIYEGHGNSHILFLSYHSEDDPGYICQCCSYFITALFYKCWSCPNFELHVNCALLPGSVTHKFDRHPLQLALCKISAPKEDEDFCEICEEDMDTKNWFYRCIECVTLFHSKCIPCVGHFSRIKFGGSIQVRCHHCPLTSIRLLTSYSYKCGLCMETIHGRKDDRIAFECIKCRFWLCCDCAEKEWILGPSNDGLNQFVSELEL